MPIHVDGIIQNPRKSFAQTSIEMQLFSFCCDGLIVCEGKLGPGHTVMAFCRQPGVRGSVQNGCCLNRLGEFE